MDKMSNDTDAAINNTTAINNNNTAINNNSAITNTINNNSAINNSSTTSIKLTTAAKVEDVCEVCLNKDHLGRDCKQISCASCQHQHNKDLSIKTSKDEGLPDDSILYGDDCDVGMMGDDCDVGMMGVDGGDRKRGVGREMMEALELKWKGELNSIGDCKVTFETRMRNYAMKWCEAKEGLLKLKDLVKENYRELMDILITKEICDFEMIDNELSRIESKFRKQRDNMEKELSNLSEDEAKIQNKIVRLKSGLIEGFRDEKLYRLPQMHPPPNLSHYVSFEPFPVDVLFNLPATIKTYHEPVQFPGQYELESERALEAEAFSLNVRLDGRYVYVIFNKESVIKVYSLETLKLVDTIQCPHDFQPWHIICVNKYFLTSGRRALILFDENKNILEEIALPSNGWNLKSNGCHKVMITCDDNSVFSYDADARKLDQIATPAVQEIYECCSMVTDDYCMVVKMDDRCSMVTDDYCMVVKMDDRCKIVKYSQGKILKTFDVGSYDDNYANPFDTQISTNGYVYVLERRKRIVCILDGDLEMICLFYLDKTEYIYDMFVDSDWNVHISIEDSKGKFYIRKYKMK